MKKEGILAVCVMILISLSCLTVSIADENIEPGTDGPFRGSAVQPTAETEQPGHLAEFNAFKAAPAPAAIYPGDYEIILTDKLGDKFYLNQWKKRDHHYFYQGYWSSQHFNPNKYIEPVVVLYDEVNQTMTLTAVYKKIYLIVYNLLRSPTNNYQFRGGEANYAIKDHDPGNRHLGSTYVSLEKGTFPSSASSPGSQYQTP